MADHFPPNIDMETPSIARMYDYLLGGKDNFEADRKACEALADGIPELVAFANDNRAYLSRAVEYVAAQGVEQFLDLGAGLPTANNTHHAAQQANPRARVVYVDHDPIVLAHGRALISDSGQTSFLLADIRDTEKILSSPETTRLIDTDLPVCVMLVSLLHCIPDDSDPFGMVRALMDRLAPGSCLISSHIVSDDPASAAWMTDKILSFGTPWGRVRSPEEASAVFDGLDLASPWTDGRDEGPRAVDCATWRHPDIDPVFRPADPKVKLWELAGVAFKR
ncbi:SAM-dependent methyltransferase [Nocardiopsis dassonvillei]|uniref:SAM-dependent methyltransferase n=1 Tax=Nocardiopsis dassonvillei TaxID=2014 RepID=UPI00102C4EED|nr:SAM-dependent methyltransferase [Nocardiopsis dassonvillei]MCP3012639.1 SAM-dependent methyltransferase [Nocardiopsis dassonvillei]